MRLTIWAVGSCSDMGDEKLEYFYDHFVKGYWEGQEDNLPLGPAAMFNIDSEGVETCRKVLKNAFAGYRGGRNAEPLGKLAREYREYVACCHDGHAKDRYNAFVYRYMLDVHVGARAISGRLGVSKETVYNYVNEALDEILALCIGMPALMGLPWDKRAAVSMMIEGSRIFSAMAGDYVLCLFPGERERAVAIQGRKLTKDVLRQFADAVGSYCEYCNDGHTRIDTDIRKAEILRKCLAGATPAAIAEGYGCSESTVYADIRENERRLAAMLFGKEGGKN